ncbi:MAG: response regulator, partial [Lachnospiraceae bacterium]|nr:response regulator [Lachnospiraceae bacterium]
SAIPNLILYDGYTGNIYGDGLVDMLSLTISSRVFCGLMGELFVDFPDKLLSCAILFLTIPLTNFLSKKLEEHKPVHVAKLLPFLLGSGLLFALPMKVQAVPADFISSYAVTTYGIKEGLLSPEINSIVQTKDGFIWAGGYSGLYMYNGQNFESINPDNAITSVTTLYADSQGRLWIGSADSGLACYDPVTKELLSYDMSWSMPSESILAICEDNNHNIYVGTDSYIAMISPLGIVGVYNSMEELVRVTSLDGNEKGYIAGVTEEGMLFLFKDGQLLQFMEWDSTSGRYTEVAWGTDGELLVGTSTNSLVKYQLSGNHLEMRNKIKAIGLLEYTRLVYDEEAEGYFCCANNGICFLNKQDGRNKLSSGGADHDLKDILLDQQGNIWVASYRNGVQKYSASIFEDLTKQTELTLSGVNCVYQRGEDLFIGTDRGLVVVNTQTMREETYDYISGLNTMEIRHITGDRLGNIWICGGVNAGLMKINGQGVLTEWHENKDRVLGENFQQVCEMKNGDILAASDEGLSFIADGQVSRTIGAEQGLVTKKINQVVISETGRILVATEDAGIIILENNQLYKQINMSSGLGNLNVKKMVPYNHGFFYLTSNAIYYDDRTSIRKLENFPYNNNFDIMINDQGYCYVTGSAGIYVVKAEDMLEDKEYPSVLLNYKNGLNSSLVEGSFNLHNGNEMILCCTDTVLSMQTDVNHLKRTDYDIILNHLTVDEEEITPVEGIFRIPKEARQVNIYPNVLDYSVNDPYLHLTMEGPETYEEYVHQTDFKELQFSGLDAGEYTFTIQALNELTGEILLEKQYHFAKEMQIFERMPFRIYLTVMTFIFVSCIAWIISKLGTLSLVRRQYDEIRDAKEAAEHANQVKTRFLAQMSHEIRTPINSVLGMDEMILRESREKNIQEYAADIYTAGHTLLSLVNEILDFSKIESDRMEIVPVEYEVTSLIHDLYNMVAQRADEKGLKLEVDIDPDIPYMLFGDDVRVKQVITNLLTNAVKYTPTGTVWFRIKGERDGETEHLRIEVEDTGIGIKKENMPHLFDDYQRFDNKKNHYIEGTGLGLGIATKLLHLMHSRLRVESVYGEGSKFYFEIDQKIVDEKPIGDFNARVSTSHVDVSGNKAFIAPDASVLVVDDNSMNRRVFKSLLKRTKMTISEAGGGAESIELARHVKFDMIFMDHMMPEVDGVEAFHRIREGLDSVNRMTPIIVLTANAVAGAKEEYLEEGFDGFLSKPIVYDKLEASLRKFLPEEKLQPAPENDDIYTEELAPVNAVPEDLPIVEGLDWSVAWLHLPKMDLLQESVKEFYELLPVHGDKLQSMYQSLVEGGTEEAFDAYRIQVHAMKSSAATLGIIPLAGMAKVLEFAARDHNTDRILQVHPTFMEEWFSYQEKLTGLFGIGEETEKQAAEAGILDGFITVLSAALADMDIDTADDVMNRMKGYAFPDEIQALIPSLSAAVADLDEEGANGIMQKMKELEQALS